MKLKLHCTVLAAGVGAMLAAGFASAQGVQRIVNAEQRRIQQAQASQERVDATVQRTRSLTEEYKAVRKEIDGLQVYNTLLDRQIQNQETELSQLRESIDQVTVIERQILPLLGRMIEGLDKFVELDVPFLIEERRDRVAELQTLMEQSNVTAAEKFRKVMEAWQIENDYGRNIEAYTGTLDINGQDRQVDFLRIGRVGLYYMTPDGAELGVWDQKARQWSALGSGNRNQIRQGLRIARSQAAPDLLLLPIAAPERG